jgi:ABC-type multidrug transport system fused ATPase/permease subunit
MDLAGVVLLGLVGMLAISAISGQPPPNQVRKLFSAFGLGMSDPAPIAVLAGIASTLLLAKNVIAPLLMRRILRFLARREALISARLTRELLSRPLTFIQQRSSQETASALTDGTNAATNVVLGQAVVAASEISLLTLLGVLLLVVNPPVALGFIAFFAIIGFGLHRLMAYGATRLGTQRRRSGVASLIAVQEAVGTYREITVADRRMYYVDRIQGLRKESAEASAGLQFLAMLPKYIAEGALVLGAFALAGFIFATQPVAVAAGTLALFLVTATRAMPSLLRLQSAITNIRGVAESASSTYQLAADLGHPLDAPRSVESTETVRQMFQSGNLDFVPDIDLHDVTFTYPGEKVSAIGGISLAVGSGKSVAFVGRSGAGKSTLADLILGVLKPDSGTVTVSGADPTDAVRIWPGRIAYVPQDVMLTNDSVRANVGLGLSRDAIDDESVWDALRRAHLDVYLRGLPAGLDTKIGERGLRLSGGQRQRLGIARALFGRPRLLVLDEATSALDAETEQAITTMLKGLDNDVTVVIIAHRLSTIRHVDLVVYLQDGRVLATGTFDELCDRIPALQRQAALMGMKPSSAGFQGGG